MQADRAPDAVVQRQLDDLLACAWDQSAVSTDAPTSLLPDSVPAATANPDFFDLAVGDMDLLDAIGSAIDGTGGELAPVQLELGYTPSVAVNGTQAPPSSNPGTTGDTSTFNDASSVDWLDGGDGDALPELPFEDLVGRFVDATDVAEDRLAFPSTGVVEAWGGATPRTTPHTVTPMGAPTHGAGGDVIMPRDLGGCEARADGRYAGATDESVITVFAAEAAKVEFARRVVHQTQSYAVLPPPHLRTDEDSALAGATSAAERLVEEVSHLSKWLPFTASGLRKLREASSRMQGALREHQAATEAYLRRHPDRAAMPAGSHAHDDASASPGPATVLWTPSTVVTVDDGASKLGQARPARFKTAPRPTLARRSRVRVVGSRSRSVSSSPGRSSVASGSVASSHSGVVTAGMGAGSGAGATAGHSCPGCAADGPVWGAAAHKAAGLTHGRRGKVRGKKHNGLPGEKVDPILNKAISQGCTVRLAMLFRACGEPCDGLTCVCVCVCTCVCFVIPAPAQPVPVVVGRVDHATRSARPENPTCPPPASPHPRCHQAPCAVWHTPHQGP